MKKQQAPQIWLVEKAPRGISNPDKHDLLSAVNYLSKCMRSNKFAYPAFPGRVQDDCLKTFMVMEGKVPQMREFFDNNVLDFDFDFKTERCDAPGKVIARFFFRKKKSVR